MQNPTSCEPSDAGQQKTPHWTYKEHGGNAAHSTSPAMLVAVNDGTMTCPAMIFNQNIMDKIKKLSLLRHNVQMAKTNWQEHDGILIQEETAAGYQVEMRRTFLNGVKKEVYKNKYQDKLRPEDKIKLIESNEAYKKATQTEKKIKAKRGKLVEEVRRAERLHYELLQQIEEAMVGSLASAGIPDEEFQHDSASPLTRPLQYTSSLKTAQDPKSHEVSPNVPPSAHPPEQKGPSLDGTSKKSAQAQEISGSKGVTCKPSLDESLKQATETPDPVDLIIDASENLNHRRHNLRETQQMLIQHHDTYDEQCEDYAQLKTAPKKELASEFGPIFASRGFELSGKVHEAEKALVAAKRDAKAARIPFLEDQESGFFSLPDEGFSGDDHRAGVDSIDRQRIIDWMEDAERPAKRARRIRPTPSEFMNILDFYPVQPSDSLSVTEARPNMKRKILTWNERTQMRQRMLAEKTKKRRGSF